MHCSAAGGGTSGTSIRPPAATRHGQYEKRPVGSFGPTIRPGRTIVARAPNAAFSAASQAPFCGP